MADKSENDSKGAFYILLIGLLIVFAFLLIFSSNKLAIPYRAFTVETGSMKPTLKVGDLVVVKQETSYNTGDVITFASSNLVDGKQQVVTHRIVDSKSVDGKTEYTTKGDFNNVADKEPVLANQVIGKYFFKVPLIGTLIAFMRTTVGFMLVLVVPATIIIYEELRKLTRALRNKHEIQLST